MKNKFGRLLRRNKSKPDLYSISASSSTDKQYAECVVNRAALALDERQDVESRASGSDAQRMPATAADVGGGAPTITSTPLGLGPSGGSMGVASDLHSGPSNNGPGGAVSHAASGSNSSMYGGSTSNQSVYGTATVTPSVVSGLSTMDSAFDSRKLVIQYFLQDAEATYADDGRRKSLGAGMAVKVKARVENAPLSLEDNLRIQLEEDRRALERDSRRELSLPRPGGFVHCVAPPSSNIDASDAIGLVSNYVVAYRALHRTCDRPLRRHDKLLITNAHGSLGRSLVELALLSGASVVFGTAPPKYHERLSKWGATPLDADDTGPDGWSELLLGSVDVVIDTDAGDACMAAPLVANQATGKLVRILTGPNAGGDVKIWRKKNSLMDQPVRTTFYDVFHDMEVDPTGFRTDLQLLFDMMYEGSIRPRKKKAIPLLGVSYIELRFDRAPDGRRPSGEAASASSRHSRSKSVGSTRSNGRGAVRSQSNSRVRPEQAPSPVLEVSKPMPQANQYLERRSKSAPRASGRGWDDAVDEIAARARAAKSSHESHKRSSSRGSSTSRSKSRSKERSRSSSRHRREEDEIARRSRQRLADDDRLAIQQKGSSASHRSGSRSKADRDSSSRRKRSNSSSKSRDDDGRRSERDRRSRSEPRVRSESNGSSASRSARRKMKSGRTDKDRSKSAPRERWNDENDGGAGGNNRYDDRSTSKSYSRSESATRSAARVFDFSFW